LWKVHMKFKATTASIVSWFQNPSSKVIWDVSYDMYMQVISAMNIRA
jgi:hypothetical protein